MLTVTACQCQQATTRVFSLSAANVVTTNDGEKVQLIMQKEKKNPLNTYVPHLYTHTHLKFVI